MSSNNRKQKAPVASSISETDMTYGKIKVSALALAIGCGIMSFSQYFIIEVAIVICIICVLLMIPFVGTTKIYFQRAQRKIKTEHYPIIQKHVGFLTVFSNRQVIRQDCFLIGTVLLAVVAIICKWTQVYLWTAVRTIGLYSFLVHCFYNGKVYNTLKQFENEK